MKITICGSLNFAGEMKKIEKELTAKGHEVLIPRSISDHSLDSQEDAERFRADEKQYFENKPDYTKRHFNKVAEGDAILVVNMKKRGIENYIGGATFAEIMIAFHFDKKIFFLNPIPADEKLSFFLDELKAVNPAILNGNLNMVKD